MGSLRVRHDWVISLSLFLSCIGEGNGNPLQCSCLETPRDGGAWWAAISGVTHSRAPLKRLSSSSSSSMYISMLLFQFVPPSPSLSVSTHPFSTSGSLLSPWKQVHLLFSRFYIYALIYDVCIPPSDLLHSAWQTVGPSTLLRVT